MTIFSDMGICQLVLSVTIMQACTKQAPFGDMNVTRNRVFFKPSSTAKMICDKRDQHELFAPCLLEGMNVADSLFSCDGMFFAVAVVSLCY